MNISKEKYHRMVQRELLAMSVVDNLKGHLGKTLFNLRDLETQGSGSTRIAIYAIALEYERFYQSCEKLIKDFDERSKEVKPNAAKA